MTLMNITVTRIKRLASAPPLPTISKADAQSWFSGWWHGIAVGIVIGGGIAAVAVKEILKCA